MKNNDLDNIQKELEVLKKSINEMMEKTSFSNRIKAGLMGAATVLTPSIKTVDTADKPPTAEAPVKMPEAPKQQNYFFPPDSEYAPHEQKNPLKILTPEQREKINQTPLTRGERLQDYRDPRHIPTEEKYEKLYDIPHRMITAIRVAGELSNWKDKSKFKTLTPYQFRDVTRDSFLKRDGVDAYKDTESAIHATALHLKDNIRRIEYYQKQNDPRIKGIPLETEEDRWNLAVRLFNGSLQAARSGSSEENNDYAHRMKHGLKILQNNPNVYHLDNIIQEKRKEDARKKAVAAKSTIVMHPNLQKGFSLTEKINQLKPFLAKSKSS